MSIEELRVFQDEYETAYAVAQRELFDNDSVTKAGFQALIKAAIAQLQMAKHSTGSEAKFHKDRAREFVQILQGIAAEHGRELGIASAAPEVEEGLAESAAPEQRGGEQEEPPPNADAWLKKESPNVSFDDIAGMEELKATLRKAISDDQTDRLYGYHPPRSFLLYGPPGTGKTTVSKALATQLMGQGGTFYTASCSNLISKYRGDTAKNIRALFTAVQGADHVCLFLDEFDALCPARGGGENQQSNNQMVSELLQCVDEFNRNETCVLITATNNPWQIDSAMLSRLKKRCYVPLPDRESRRAAAALLLRKEVDILPRDEAILDQVTEATEGFNFRDVESFCNEIRGILSSRHTSSGMLQIVTPAVVEAARERVKSSVQEKDLGAFAQWENTAIS